MPFYIFGIFGPFDLILLYLDGEEGADPPFLDFSISSFSFFLISVITSTKVLRSSVDNLPTIS